MGTEAINTIICGDWIEAPKSLPTGCVQCIITSPPYWAQRNYGVEGQLGLEKTPEEHIARLVEGFRGLWRILRPDGVMFVNYGDKYAGGEGGDGKKNKGSLMSMTGRGLSLPSGSLLGLAWRLALALQADGWILRSDIIWAKAVSFNEKYSGSTMPESINGTRWERCRVKVKATKPKRKQPNSWDTRQQTHDTVSGANYYKEGEQTAVEWAECPGCPQCEANDGYVLRRGSWRCTRAHEYVFQFVKQLPYYCDMEVVKEEATGDTHSHGNKLTPPNESAGIGHIDWSRSTKELVSSRNLRDVWTINPQPNSDHICLGCGHNFDSVRAKRRIKTVLVEGEKKQKCPECGAIDQWLGHYATFPEDLVEPCIKVATSWKGCCPKCGAPWARIIDSKQIKRKRPNDRTDRHHQEGMNSCGNTVAGTETKTLGWKATCACGLEETVPCVVYDPFMGSGTVAAVAARLGRNYMGTEINADYIDKQARPRIAEAETGIPQKEKGQGALVFQS